MLQPRQAAPRLRRWLRWSRRGVRAPTKSHERDGAAPDGENSMTAYPNETDVERMFAQMTPEAPSRDSSTLGTLGKVPDLWRVVGEDGSTSVCRPVDKPAIDMPRPTHRTIDALANLAKSGPVAKPTLQLADEDPTPLPPAESLKAAPHETGEVKTPLNTRILPRRVNHDQELARLVEAWPTLSPRIRGAIMAMLEAATPTGSYLKRPI